MIAILMRRQFFSQTGLIVAVSAMFFVPLVLLAFTPDPAGILGAEAGMIPVCMFRYGFRYRATHFEAALPIAGRDLYLARALCNLALVWSPLPALVIVTLLRRGPHWQSLLLNLTQGAVILSLAVVMPLAARLREFAAPGWMAAALCGATGAAGLAAWLLLPAGVVLAGFALATAAVIAGTWRSVPLAFQAAPVEAAEADVKAPAGTGRRNLPGHGAMLLLRKTVPWQFWLFPLLLLILGPFGTGSYFLTIYAFQGTQMSRMRTRWMQALPLSYRALLAITLAVTVLPLAGASGIGMYLGRLTNFAPRRSLGTGPIVQRNNDNEWQRTNVPLEYWRYAPGGKAPAIVAPWGETVQPETLSILGFDFYNPFFTRPSNSRRFVDWQFENATEALHGRRIPYSEYHASERASLPLPTDQPGIQILGLAGLLTYSLFLVWFSELARWNRLWRPGARNWRIGLMSLIGSPVAAAYATDMFHLTRHSTGVFMPLATAALLHFTKLLPSNLLVVTVAAAVPVMAMYAALERQFRVSELTGMVKQTGC